MTETRLYGVSSGDGSNGVSHIFADYYVRTSQPWRLARLAALTEFKPDWIERARDVLNVDGESDYTISAVIYDPLDQEECEEGESWCDNNGAWRIWEVFPEDEPCEGRPLYESIEDCFGDDAALVSDED